MSILDFTASFAGVKPLGSYVAIPEMPIKARVKSIEVNDHKSEPGAKVAQITLTVTEPGYEGAERRFNARIPDQTEKGQNARRGWRTLLEAIGYTAAQLDGANAVRITSEIIVGKEGTFYHKPGQQGVPGSYDDVDAILPSVYAERNRARAANGGTMPATAAASPFGGAATLSAVATLGGAAPAPATLGGPSVIGPAATADMRASLLA